MFNQNNEHWLYKVLLSTPNSLDINVIDRCLFYELNS